jgi:uncharacterized RDD family membrane protein YckC
MDTVAAIETPERVMFRFRVAGPARRAAAWAIDGAILGTLLGVAALVGEVSSLVPMLRGVGAMTGMIATFFLQWFYGLAAEWALDGRTPGKIALSIRVVRDDGASPAFQDLFLRNLLRGVDALAGMGGVGVIVMWLDPKMRRIGDLAAGTLVVCDDAAVLTGSLHIDPPITDAERRALPARVALTRQELALIEGLLTRRRTLTDERTEELAALLGPKLAAQTGVQAPTWRRTLALAYARATGADGRWSEGGA